MSKEDSSEEAEAKAQGPPGPGFTVLSTPRRPPWHSLGYQTPSTAASCSHPIPNGVVRKGAGRRNEGETRAWAVREGAASPRRGPWEEAANCTSYQVYKFAALSPCCAVLLGSGLGLGLWSG